MLGDNYGRFILIFRTSQVRAGEVVTSARAIDHHTMKLLWEHNLSFPRDTETRPQKRKNLGEHEQGWAGYQTRQMLQLLYTVSMLCLLRYDEALRIMWSDVDFIMLKGQPVVKLNLPFRKTHQTGGRLLAFILELI